VRHNLAHGASHGEKGEGREARNAGERIGTGYSRRDNGKVNNPLKSMHPA